MKRNLSKISWWYTFIALIAFIASSINRMFDMTYASNAFTIMGLIFVFNVIMFTILEYSRREIKMPNGDGTGPNGEGPRTGRGKGGC